MNKGVLAIAISGVMFSFFTTIVNTFPNRKILSYSYKEQLSDFVPPMICALIMCIIVNCISYLECSLILKLFI